MVQQIDNTDAATVDGFGREWSRFDQSDRPAPEAQRVFEYYFRIFPWDSLPECAQGIDVGCGSGRWARLVAAHPKIGFLNCIDASSEAVAVARRNLGKLPNVTVFTATPETMTALVAPDDSLDFGYCLGVLHCIPDPLSALRACVRKLKPGAPFLVYFYYAPQEIRPGWFTALWHGTDVVRRLVSRAPYPVKFAFAEVVAATLYWPAARVASPMIAHMYGEEAGERVPLSRYRDKGFKAMRTDALDRFGTRVEHRVTRAQLATLLTMGGLERITVDGPPYWMALGYKA